MANENLISRDWPAPAKLNLFLHVVGRRDDGYHLLQTAFQFIDYCDLLDFTTTSDGSISLESNYSNLPREQDLVYRAAKLLQQASGTDQGATIRIEKKLPMGGGLGGGSSNAATALVALNHLWQLEPGRVQLAELGLRLGADVPVFIHGHAAFAEGVGERLEMINPEELWYLVIHPGCTVSTASIFGAVDLTRNTPPITIRDFLRDGGHNDCEGPARRQFPEISEALEWLETYGRARMTGTGSCIFTGFNDREQAQAACRQVPAKWKGFIARGVNRSPLLSRLAEAEKE